jgi:hypothetical protein
MQTVLAYHDTAPILVFAGARVDVPNAAGVTPAQMACSLLAHRILAIMVPRHHNMQLMTTQLMRECMHWTHAGMPGPLIRCINIVLASGGVVSADGRSLSSTVLAGSLAGDVVWHDSSVPPLQVIARRHIRRALARTWLHTHASHQDLNAYLVSVENLVQLPPRLATYVTHPLPSPHHTPGSSFQPETLHGVGQHFRRIKGLCIHYNDPATCSLGDCGQ